VTDREKNKLWEDRAEWLTTYHKVGSFTIYFDADLSAVVISSGSALVLIPVGEISKLSGLLAMMANQLLVVGII
jgi:hypothetical protein